MGFFQMIEAAFGLSRKSARILVIGLDNSGKSTIIDHLKPKKTSSTEITPTVGFQVEEFTKNSINFTVYDMSGQGRYRSLWEHYYTDVEAIIFVLDSTDRLRMCVAKEELIQLLSHEEIKKTRAPVLFFANKIAIYEHDKSTIKFAFSTPPQMDVPGALTPEECMDEMDLDTIRDKAWHITSSNALTGVGVNEGIEWLCANISNAKRK